MPTVLLVGEDDLLLQTRAAVLRTTGAVTVCSKAASALATQRIEQCDLVVLCHSVPEANCVLLAYELHRLWPGTPVLLITRTMTWENSHPDIIHEVTSADPERLIQRAVQLIAHRPPGSLDPLELQRSTLIRCLPD